MLYCEWRIRWPLLWVFLRYVACVIYYEWRLRWHTWGSLRCACYARSCCLVVWGSYQSVNRNRCKLVSRRLFGLYHHQTGILDSSYTKNFGVMCGTTSGFWVRWNTGIYLFTSWIENIHKMISCLLEVLGFRISSTILNDSVTNLHLICSINLNDNLANLYKAMPEKCEVWFF